MNPKSLIEVIALAFAAAVISLTITKSSLFEHPRKWVLERSEWLGKLVSCAYCTSHWVSFALVAIYQPRIIQSAWWPLDLIVSACVLVALAMPVSFVVYKSFQGMTVDNSDETELLRAALEKAKEKLIEQAAQIKALSNPDVVSLRVEHRTRSERS